MHFLFTVKIKISKNHSLAYYELTLLSNKMQYVGGQTYCIDSCCFNKGVYFSVSSVILENQIDKNLSYFNLKVSLSSSQKLKVKIFNNKKHDIKVKAMVTSAITCRNGFISYTTNLTNYDESLRISASGYS